ncbi:MAG TPA: hypothetical protein VFH27_08290, partial [Longimicrobiaceae bacterium]|nr:hypothetical protein [Longimicrobiaceae bacterium]
DPHRHVDSIQLRLIAEAASGIRGMPVHFVAMEDGTVREVLHPEHPDHPVHPTPPARGDAGDPKGIVPPPLEMPVVVPAFTEDVLPAKPPLDFAAIRALGVAERIDLLDLPGGLGAADAVFWSESAVEKFLIPYYASVYGNQAALAVGDILEAFHGDRGDGGTHGGPRLTDPDGLTYAMAHLPKSEYVILSDSDNVGMSLAVIYEDPETPGTLNAKRLPDFLRWRRARRQG